MQGNPVCLLQGLADEADESDLWRTFDHVADKIVAIRLVRDR